MILNGIAAGCRSKRYFVVLGEGFFFSAVFGGFFYEWKRNFESGVLVA